MTNAVEKNSLLILILMLYISCKHKTTKVDLSIDANIESKEVVIQSEKKKEALNLNVFFKDFGEKRLYNQIEWNQVDYDSLMTINLSSDIKEFKKKIKIKRRIYGGNAPFDFILKKTKNNTVSLSIIETPRNSFKDSLIFSIHKKNFKLNESYFIISSKIIEKCMTNIFVKDSTIHLDASIENYIKDEKCVKIKR